MIGKKTLQHLGEEEEEAAEESETGWGTRIMKERHLHMYVQGG